MRFWKYFVLSTIFFIVFSGFVFKTKTQRQFFDYFEAQSLRIDYLLVGDSESEIFILQQLKKGNVWAGPQRLVNGHVMDMGNYRLSVYDSISEELLYQKGFCSLFQEWQSTDEAKNTSKAFYHVNVIPFPKKTIRYELQKRQFNDGKFTNIKSIYINPKNYFILNEKPLENEYSLLFGENDPRNKIDIAFLAEGYTKEEMPKFEEDVKRLWNYITSIKPFDQNKSYFNVYAVHSISNESGTDIPGKQIYKNTAVNSSFYTFDIERYLTSIDIKSMHDQAEVVPYDHIYVLVNSTKYGGGGFYNYYSITSVDHVYSEKVAIHEFGHGFAGLADEYYTSEVAFNDLYNLEVEPWEPNISTLVAFNTKWQDMLHENTPIPTPRGMAYQDSIGVFKGGGYSSEGIYSPSQDCRMKSNMPEGFCPVCSKAIQNTIDYYIGE